jgi:hypothetical protein
VCTRSVYVSVHGRSKSTDSRAQAWSMSGVTMVSESDGYGVRVVFQLFNEEMMA